MGTPKELVQLVHVVYEIFRTGIGIATMAWRLTSVPQREISTPSTCIIRANHVLILLVEAQQLPLVSRVRVLAVTSQVGAMGHQDVYLLLKKSVRQ